MIASMDQPKTSERKAASTKITRYAGAVVAGPAGRAVRRGCQQTQSAASVLLSAANGPAAPSGAAGAAWADPHGTGRQTAAGGRSEHHRPGAVHRAAGRGPGGLSRSP